MRIKIANRDAGDYVSRKVSFQGSNLIGVDYYSLYTVFSYNTAVIKASRVEPLVISTNFKWSPTTSKQITQCLNGLRMYVLEVNQEELDLCTTEEDIEKLFKDRFGDDLEAFFQRVREEEAQGINVRKKYSLR